MKSKFKIEIFAFYLLFVVLGWADSADAANITLTVSTAPVIVGSQVTFNWLTAGDVQSAYQLLVYRNGVLYHDTLQVNNSNKTLILTSLPAGNYTWQIRVLTNVGVPTWTAYTTVDCFPFSITQVPPNTLSEDDLWHSQVDYCLYPPAATLYWDFSDPNPGDTQGAYRVQVDDESNFLLPLILDSTKVSSASEAYGIGGGILSYNKTYYWRVMVWDNYDLASSWSAVSSFETPKHLYPTPDFSWYPLNPSVNEYVQFTDESTVYGGATKSVWAWVFDNASPSSSGDQNPIIEFLDDGNQNVSLTITDSDGYACSTDDGAFSGVGVRLPLPGWKEVSP